MTVAQSIATAYLPESHVVCGVRLRAFSIGHWLHLNRHGVSFVSGTNHDIGHLLTAVLICSETYEGFISGLVSGQIEKAIKSWQRRLSGGLFGKIRRKLRGKRSTVSDIIGFEFAKECDAFQNYLDSHGLNKRINDWAIPSIRTRGSGEEKDSGVPEIAELLDALITELHIEYKDVLNLPLPQCRWLWSVHAARKDWVSIVNLDEARQDQKEADEFAKLVLVNGNGN